MPISYGGDNITFPDASTQNTSPKTGFVNRIINGAMTIFQRGTAATANAQYSVDRWRLVKSNDATESTTQNSDAPIGFNYSLRNTISTGDASIGAAQYSGLDQLIEGFNVADLGFGTANASPVTLSFWVKSSVTGQYTGNINNAEGTRILPFNYTISTANTWEFKTITTAGDTSGTWNKTNGSGLSVTLYAALGSSFTGGTAGVWGTAPNFGCGSPVNGIGSNGNIFAISGVQLEKGSTATPFEFRSYGDELALCERYCQKVAFNIYIGNGAGYFWSVPINFQTSMRVAPTFGAFSGGSTGDISVEVVENISSQGLRYTILATAVNAYAVGRTATASSEL